MDAMVRGGGRHPSARPAVRLDSDGDEIMRDSPLLRGPVTSATDTNNSRGDGTGSVLRTRALDHDEVMDDLALVKGKGPAVVPQEAAISSIFSNIINPYQEDHGGFDPPTILGCLLYTSPSPRD